MRRRGHYWEALAILGVCLFFLFLIVGVPLLSLAATDWDWRCLFAECRIDK